MAFLFVGQISCQETPSSAPAKPPAIVKNPWTFNLTTDGYIIPNETDYASPVLSADHSWLHLEARYNYENLRTGSCGSATTSKPEKNWYWTSHR